MAEDRATRLGERLLFHRERTPYCEIDLFFEAPLESNTFQSLPAFERRKGAKLFTLIEVKTIVMDLWAMEPVSRRQRQRLERARLYFQSRLQAPVRLLLATVHVSREEHGSGLVLERETRIEYFDLSTVY